MYSVSACEKSYIHALNILSAACSRVMGFESLKFWSSAPLNQNRIYLFFPLVILRLVLEFSYYPGNRWLTRDKWVPHFVARLLCFRVLC